MGLQYLNLDSVTRELMAAEIDRDIAAGTLYISENLNQQGIVLYPRLLKEAASAGTDVSLAIEIRPLLNSHEKPRKLKSGGFTKPPIMRSNAHEMLAEGEFNRFYIRAICLRALQSNATTIEIYRAKNVEHPRTESIAKIGTRIDAQSVLNDLRARPGVDTALGLPPGPNVSPRGAPS
jgi:hypothetical protein